MLYIKKTPFINLFFFYYYIRKFFLSRNTESSHHTCTLVEKSPTGSYIVAGKSPSESYINQNQHNNSGTTQIWLLLNQILHFMDNSEENPGKKNILFFAFIRKFFLLSKG